MTNACRECITIANDAWDAVSEFLLRPPRSVTRSALEQYKAYVRLAWRIEQGDDHDATGWVLETLHRGGFGEKYLWEVEKFEKLDPVVYPRSVRIIQELIERRCKNIEDYA